MPINPLNQAIPPDGEFAADTWPTGLNIGPQIFFQTPVPPPMGDTLDNAMFDGPIIKTAAPKPKKSNKPLLEINEKAKKSMPYQPITGWEHWNTLRDEGIQVGRLDEEGEILSLVAHDTYPKTWVIQHLNKLVFNPNMRSRIIVPVIVEYYNNSIGMHQTVFKVLGFYGFKNWQNFSTANLVKKVVGAMQTIHLQEDTIPYV